MSQFTLASAAFGTAGFQRMNNYAACDPTSAAQYAVTEVPDQPFADGALWGRPRWCGGEMGMGMLNLDAGTNGCYQQPPQAGGGQQQKKIIGTTRDSGGAVLGSCVVQGFVTSTDAFVNQLTSDTAGYFELPTQFVGVAHYLVCYKAGSPDVGGTSLNTIVPT